MKPWDIEVLQKAPESLVMLATASLSNNEFPFPTNQIHKIVPDGLEYVMIQIFKWRSCPRWVYLYLAGLIAYPWGDLTWAFFIDANNPLKQHKYSVIMVV